MSRLNLMINSRHLKHFILALVLITFFVIYLTQLLYVIDNRFVMDDAFIYLRYARNISQGYGFVWNPGELPVEGFTSILYLMILVVIEKLNLPTLFLAPTIGMVCSLLILIMSWKLGEMLIPKHYLEKSLSVILIGLSPTFMFWTDSGMDIALYSALVLLSVIIYINYLQHKSPAWLVVFMFAITSFGRPEGLYLFGATLLFDILVNHKKILSRHILAMFIAFCVIYIPVFAWKWLYFGYPFPNTYYAKTGGLSTIKYQFEGGAIYLGRGLFSLVASLGVPIILLLSRLRKISWNRTISKEIAYLFGLVVISWGGILVNGGDHFVYSRFLMPTIPLATILIIMVGVPFYLENIKIDNKIFSILIAAIIFMTSFLFWKPWTLIFPAWKNTSLPKPNASYLEYFNDWDSGFINMGKTLSSTLPKDSTIAVVPVGAIGYYSNMTVIDMVGIVDSVEAHEPLNPYYASTWRPGHDKGDGAYILNRQPDYIQLIDSLTSLPFPELDDSAKQYKSIIEVWNSPEFQSNYEFYPIRTKEGWYYNLYRRIGK